MHDDNKELLPDPPEPSTIIRGPEDMNKGEWWCPRCRDKEVVSSRDITRLFFGGTVLGAALMVVMMIVLLVAYGPIFGG